MRSRAQGARGPGLVDFGWKLRAAAIGCAAAMVVVLGAGAAAAKVGADLKVVKGKVQTKRGNLKGSFAVRNVGKAKAKRSITLLRVEVPGKDRKAERYATPALAPGETAKAKVKVGVPSGVPSGKWPIQLCADQGGKVKESSERNNCKKVGKVKSGAGGSGGPGSEGGGSGSSVPKDPIDYPSAQPFQLNSSESAYWAYVPSSYDASNQTPTKLFVWSHGCGGESGGDIFTVSPGGSQDWISISVGGRDGECWDPASDQPKVLKAIATIKTHFNIDPRSVILGGYSSGGDLSYRTAFENSRQIAGVLAENTSPFRDTGLSGDAALAGASAKLHVVHLAHLQDDAYPIAGVRQETDAMVAAGFPLTRVEVNGSHYDNPGDVVAGMQVPGTDPDVATYLLPRIDDGWTSPGLRLGRGQLRSRAGKS